MHEFALVESIFQILNFKINELNLKKINQVKLVVGEMANVEEMTLSACFEMYAQNTAAEGAELVYERVPLQGRCAHCGHSFKIEHYAMVCPLCGDRGVEVIAGRELYVDSLVAE